MHIGPAPPAITLVYQPGLYSDHAQDGRGLSLRPQQVVQATVAEGGLSRAELELRGYRFRAQTKVPLKTGQKLQLQVMKTSPHVELKILHQHGLQHMLRALHLLGEKINLKSVVHSMLSKGSEQNSRLPGQTIGALESLMRLLADPGKNLRGSDLMQLANLCGLDMEARLARGEIFLAKAGLKSALLSLLEHSDQQSWKEEGNTLLSQLEIFQLCKVRLWQENVHFLPLPFFQKGYMFIEEDGGGGQAGSESSYRININLQLSGLGNLQLIIFYEPKGLLLRILCESDKEAKFISSFTDEMKDNLTGVYLQNVSVGTGAEDPGKILINKLFSEGENFLDAQV